MGSVARRRFMQMAGAAAAVSALPMASLGGAPTRVSLRVLATSDLHMFLDDYDYYRDRIDETVGLVRTAGLIARARHERRNSLLFDNGDFLQGNPLADYLAQHPHEMADHPLLTLMGVLGYDAITLGNHEFNYGLDYLDRFLAGMPCPVVSTNLKRADGRFYGLPSVILNRDFMAEDGTLHALKIGVLGVVPPQIMGWDRVALEGRLTVEDAVDAVGGPLAALRGSVDLVVMLCHGGIVGGPRQGRDENPATHLAALPGIDVLITGHAHRVFPGPDFADLPGVDPVAGTIHGVPTVMPGFWGSHLGQIDLTLERGDGGWRVISAQVETPAIAERRGAVVTALVAPQQALKDKIAGPHRATIDAISQPIGRITAPIESYFALVRNDAALELVNRAQVWYATPLLANGPYRGMPILSAAAPFKVGGGLGPDGYVAIKAGNVSLKNIADLYLYPNLLQAVKVTGRGVAEWLERSVSLFNQIDPQGRAPQMLLPPLVTPYNFDVFMGVTYGVDVSQPPRYGANGALINQDARRIGDLRFGNRPIDPDQEFIVVTNSYRAGGGGKFPGLDGRNIVLEAPDTNRDAVVRYVTALGTVDPTPSRSWYFLPLGGIVPVTIDSAPAARSALPADGTIAVDGDADRGFVRYRLTLGG